MENPAPTEKCCQWCFDYLVQRPDESDKQFASRNYCCQAHAGHHNQKKRKGVSPGSKPQHTYKNWGSM